MPGHWPEVAAKVNTALSAAATKVTGDFRRIPQVNKEIPAPPLAAGGSSVSSCKGNCHARVLAASVCSAVLTIAADLVLSSFAFKLWLAGLQSGMDEVATR
jgi:hypothetical protein